MDKNNQEKPSKDSPVIGYAKRFPGQSVGKLVMGSSYLDNSFGSIESTQEDGGEINLGSGSWTTSSFGTK